MIHVHKRNPDFSIVVYVNNVHISVVHRRIHDHRGGRRLSFTKRKMFFIINISLCFCTKAAKREKFACRETYTMFACGEQMALDLLLLPGLISAAPDLSQAVPVVLRGSRSLHSQVCRVCRFCAASDFFLFLFSSALGATREKRRGGGSHAAG